MAAKPSSIIAASSTASSPSPSPSSSLASSPSTLVAPAALWTDRLPLIHLPPLPPQLWTDIHRRLATATPERDIHANNSDQQHDVVVDDVARSKWLWAAMAFARMKLTSITVRHNNSSTTATSSSTPTMVPFFTFATLPPPCSSLPPSYLPDTSSTTPSSSSSPSPSPSPVSYPPAGLRWYIDDYLSLSARADFHGRIIPFLQQLVASLPQLFPVRPPLLFANQARTLHFTQAQVACLLACSFFGLHVRGPGFDASRWAEPNCDVLFASLSPANTIAIAKMELLINYFHHMHACISMQLPATPPSAPAGASYRAVLLAQSPSRARLVTWQRTSLIHQASQDRHNDHDLTTTAANVQVMDARSPVDGAPAFPIEAIGDDERQVTEFIVCGEDTTRAASLSSVSAATTPSSSAVVISELKRSSPISSASSSSTSASSTGAVAVYYDGIASMGGYVLTSHASAPSLLEQRFMIWTETLVTMIICESLHHDETLAIIGAEQFAAITPPAASVGSSSSIASSSLSSYGYYGPRNGDAQPLLEMLLSPSVAPLPDDKAHLQCILPSLRVYSGRVHQMSSAIVCTYPPLIIPSLSSATPSVPSQHIIWSDDAMMSYIKHGQSSYSLPLNECHHMAHADCPISSVSCVTFWNGEKVAIGNWNCRLVTTDVEVTSILQWLAAARSLRSLSFFMARSSMLYGSNLTSLVRTIHQLSSSSSLSSHKDASMDDTATNNTNDDDNDESIVTIAMVWRLLVAYMIKRREITAIAASARAATSDPLSSSNLTLSSFAAGEYRTRLLSSASSMAVTTTASSSSSMSRGRGWCFSTWTTTK